MKKNHSFALALAFGASALAAASVANAADIDVRSGGSIASAIRTARPGDRVLVHAGTYTGGGWIGPVNGTASAPITVLSVDGPRRAVIEGGGETLRIGDASSYLVFDGFEIRNAGDNVIHIDGGCHHITLRNLYVHDAGTNGDVVKINQCNHMTIEDSEFARPGRRTSDAADNPYQECLDFVDVDDSVVRDNFIHDGGSMLMFVKGGSRNTVIERNVYSEQRAGASDPMVGLGGPTDLDLLGGEQYEIIGVVFRNNIVWGGRVGAIAVYDGNGVFIANNLLRHTARGLVASRAATAPAAQSTTVGVVDNLWVHTRGSMPTPYMRSSHGLTDFATDSNLFWNAGRALPTSSLLTIASQPGHIASDPHVGVPAAGSGRAAIIAAMTPPSSSPGAASGMDSSVTPYGVVDDINGAPRGAIHDRGPFAMSAGGTVPPPPPTDAGTIEPPPPPTDAGTIEPPPPPTDAGTVEPPPPPTDAGTVEPPVDPGTGRQDSGASVPPTDSGTGSNHDAATSTDASVGDDGGDTDPGSQPGVGCNVGSRGTRASAWPISALAALGIAAFVSRMRRRLRG